MAKRKKKSDRALPAFRAGNTRAVRPKRAVHLGEDPDKFHPFRVQLLVQASPLKGVEPKPAVYYVRGPLKGPDVCCMMAEQLWQKWEKHDKGLGDQPYPDVLEHAFAEVCDEDDFWNAWQEIRKHELDSRVAGDPDDPMAFTCIGRTDL